MRRSAAREGAELCELTEKQIVLITVAWYTASSLANNFSKNFLTTFNSPATLTYVQVRRCSSKSKAGKRETREGRDERVERVERVEREREGARARQGRERERAGSGRAEQGDRRRY